MQGGSANDDPSFIAGRIASSSLWAADSGAANTWNAKLAAAYVDGRPTAPPHHGIQRLGCIEELSPVALLQAGGLNRFVKLDAPARIRVHLYECAIPPLALAWAAKLKAKHATNNVPRSSDPFTLDLHFNKFSEMPISKL